jgi:hypothetical protein
MFAYEPSAECGLHLRAFLSRKTATFEHNGQLEPAHQRPQAVATHVESIEATNSANVMFWAHKWGVTVIQIKIAARRVGTRPEEVFAEIVGKPKAVLRDPANFGLPIPHI